ncbi:RNB domain-containing ribonuclease [Geminocystis sp. GBBB08]|uniref:RNB domain-containing ribonuclease n=1 Tax=Geminocystis sp. GBBB08 TaxID=2604140 RepID=UPI0027E28DF2|nr:RNB domain-containing ribonuclease [Geminocystis sp. GBBB08]MBL1210847.1 RNB domain-containing ribonuclease [Geminocystis sp. GBBB08]
MKGKIQPRKFNTQQITQASNINLRDYYHNRFSVFGITIDDATTVDRDDGVWLIELNHGSFELQISIADVSTIVAKNSPIDKEALLRVATLYHTIPPTPMLPCNISTNLGSLEEEERRLALTIFFQIDNSGNVNSFRIKETIFTSKKAFSYTEVEKILTNPQDIPEHQLLLKMQKVAQLIGKKRGGKSGVLTNDGYVDEDGNLIQENVNTYQLIAELMILTNTTIANFLGENNIPALYRTQDVGTTDFELVKKTMGHLLVPAIYQSHAKPHVGLGLINYTHFTSPLRRFVDLVNHRIVKAIIKKDSFPYTTEELDNLCLQINEYHQKFKEDKSNFMRKKRREEIEKLFNNLDTLEVEKLSVEKFSDLIEYSVFNYQLEKIISHIESRLDTLQPKDFYYLWFVAKINQFFEHENIDTVSILLIKSQIDNSIIDYKLEYCEVRKLYFAYCYLNGMTTLNPVEDTKKSKAKQKAALATIQGYLTEELTYNPNPIIEANITNSLFNTQGENSCEVDFNQLNDKDFSKILDYCLKTHFDATTLQEIEARINSLLPRDLYKIWFQGRINNYFHHSNFDTVSVLLIHSQLTGCNVEYKIDYNSSIQKYIAYCYVDGLTHRHPQFDIKKTKAKQKSSLAYIQSYLNDQLTDQPDLFVEEEIMIKENLSNILNPIDKVNFKENKKEKEKKNFSEELDWVSKLHNFCQLNQLTYPEYDFNDIDGFFICKITLNYQDKIIISQGYGKSKKDAKQNASHILIIQHQLISLL